MIPPLPPPPLHLLTRREDIRASHPVFLALRPHLTDVETFVDRILAQQREGYHVVAYRHASEPYSAVAGFRAHRTLAWGHILYVDDLSTLPSARKQGQAGALLAYLEATARAWGCDELHLDSGHQRFAAHRLYHRHGLQITSHHFSRSLRSSE